MKVLITGANGQLGYHLKEVFADHELYLGDVDNFDITNRDLTLRETEAFKPDLIVHGAAFTNVDAAETSKELAFSINVTGSKHIAEAARLVDAKLVAISTDYVFAGDKGLPYLETDKPNPKSHYGQTKYEGELAVREVTPKHFICRTAWLYGGPQPDSGIDFSTYPFKNFVLTMLRLGRERDTIEVVADQVGGPTYAKDLAEYVRRIAETEQYGIYHVTNSGVTNWADFTREIFRLAGYRTSVTDLTSTQYAAKFPQAAKRPSYSVLGHTALQAANLPKPRAWQQALADFMASYQV